MAGQRQCHDPRSKLATAGGLRSGTQADTLGEELYAAMDWLLRRRPRIERHLATWHTSRTARSCSAT